MFSLFNRNQRNGRPRGRGQGQGFGQGRGGSANRGRGAGCGRGRGFFHRNNGHGCNDGYGFNQTEEAFSGQVNIRPPFAAENGVFEEVCPLCDNHCPLDAPSCPKGEAYAASARNR